MSTFKNRYCWINNSKVRYFDEGRGKAIVLIHGLGGSAVNWLKNIGSLSKSYRVIAVDLPSFGESDIPDTDLGRIDYGFFTEFLLDFLEALRVKRATLVGNSMGGGITVNTTLKHPKLVEKLVIVDSSGLGREIHFSPHTLPSNVNRLSYKLLTKEFILRRLLRIAVYDPKTLNEESIQAYIKWLKKDGVIEMIAKAIPKALGDEGQKWVFISRLAEISVPTLIIWGKNDRLLPLEHGIKASKMIKGSELVVFNKCGHVPQIERPDEFNRILLEFLGK